MITPGARLLGMGRLVIYVARWNTDSEAVYDEAKVVVRGCRRELSGVDGM